MNLHEYQSKALFRNAGIAVPDGEVVRNAEEALATYARLDMQRVVIKAQVHAGGRGKAGGVRIIDNKEDLVNTCKELIGSRLVTHQTTADGQPVSMVLLESPSEIKKELYLSILVDRQTQKVAFMVSTEGGVDIEEVAESTPDKISKCWINPIVGILPFQCRELAFALELQGAQIKQFTIMAQKLVKLFIDNDLSMVEVNPLIINNNGDLVCLDGKINTDDNALFRQPKIRELYDSTQEDEREDLAKQHELNYISLDGNIGCMVNGAGLAMATMDLIKLAGGEPANFLDVGGGATKQRVSQAFKIILSDSNVKAVLVNIFGGIVRCDLIAEGIIGAVAEVGISIPVVVRLEGNNADIGLKKLAESGLNIVAAPSFEEAAKRVVAAAKE